MDTKKSTDFYFAAALMSVGAVLEDTDKSDPKHMEFYLTLASPEFQSVTLASAVVNGGAETQFRNLAYYEKEWANGTLQVNAIKYKDAIQRLKSVIHSK
jgi:hypothetical protein